MSADWRARAACAGGAPEAFFPVAVAGLAYVRQVAAAKRVCAGCPVRAECLSWAVEALADGIAGGLTAEERRGLAVAGQAGRVVPPVGASRRERAAAGRAAIRSGRPVAEVAWEFGVSVRTAERWAADVRREQVSQGQERRGERRGAA